MQQFTIKNGKHLLVIELGAHVPEKQKEDLAIRMEDAFPNLKVLITAPGTELSIISLSDE